VDNVRNKTLTPHFEASGRGENCAIVKRREIDGPNSSSAGGWANNKTDRPEKQVIKTPTCDAIPIMMMMIDDVLKKKHITDKLLLEQLFG
jgi:hypothetical protein